MKLKQIAKINLYLMELQTLLQPNNAWYDSLEKLNEAMYQKPDMTISVISKMLDGETVAKNTTISSMTVKDYAACINALHSIFGVFCAKRPVNELNSYLKLLDRYCELDMTEFHSLLIRAIQKSKDCTRKSIAEHADAVNYYVQKILEWQNNLREMTNIVDEIKSDKRVRINEAKKIYHGVTGYIDKKKTKKAYIDAIEARTFELKLQSERIDILKQ